VEKLHFPQGDGSCQASPGHFLLHLEGTTFILALFQLHLETLFLLILGYEVCWADQVALFKVAEMF